MRFTTQGFTLIEIMAVVALMALLSGFMVPWVGNQINKTLLQAEVQELFFDLKQTQQFSLTREEGYSYYGLEWVNNAGPNSDQAGYRIVRYEPNGLTVPPPIGSTPALTVVKSDQILPAPLIYDEGVAFDPRVSLDPSSELVAGSRVIFTPEGSATNDGETLLGANGDEITLQCGNVSKKKLIFEPLTGQVYEG